MIGVWFVYLGEYKYGVTNLGVGYKYGFMHVRYRQHPLLRFVWGIASQGQMSFFYRVRASGPAGLKQTLICAPWANNVSFMYYT